MAYLCWKACFWITGCFLLSFLMLVLLVIYILISNLVTVDAIEQFGFFTLMASPLSAHRSTRNQMIATSALGYNNLTVYPMQIRISLHGTTRNTQAKAVANVNELARVEAQNQAFCVSWSRYQDAARDVTEHEHNIWPRDIFPYAQTSDGQNVSSAKVLFDYNNKNNIAMSLDEVTVNSNTNLTVFMELPKHFQTFDTKTREPLYQDWVVLSIRVEAHSTKNDSVSYEVQLKPRNETLGGYAVASVDSNAIQAKANVHNWTHTISINTKDASKKEVEKSTRFVKLVFMDVLKWKDWFHISKIRVFGRGVKINGKYLCPRIQFGYWEFDANDGHSRILDPKKNFSLVSSDGGKVYEYYPPKNEECPELTKVHGIMYKGFIRSQLDYQLKNAHRPYIDAGRNILLSPFMLIFVGIGILLMAKILSAIMVCTLMRLDLYRMNLYTKVPLVTTKDKNYDSTWHEVGDCEEMNRRASVHPAFVETENEQEQEEMELLAIMPESERRQYVPMGDPPTLSTEEVVTEQKFTTR